MKGGHIVKSGQKYLSEGDNWFVWIKQPINVSQNQTDENLPGIKQFCSVKG